MAPLKTHMKVAIFPYIPFTQPICFTIIIWNILVMYSLISISRVATEADLVED